MKTQLLLSALLMTNVVWAADESANQTHALMTPQEIELYQKAKKRLYPGGRDEDSLKVQSQLPLVLRKMAPVQDTPTEEPEEHQENDN